MLCIQSIFCRNMLPIESIFYRFMLFTKTLFRNALPCATFKIISFYDFCR